MIVNLGAHNRQRTHANAFLTEKTSAAAHESLTQRRSLGVQSKSIKERSVRAVGCFSVPLASYKK